MATKQHSLRTRQMRAALAQIPDIHPEHVHGFAAFSEAADRIAELQAENAALREQLAAAQKDADRYRWLRERMDLKDVSIYDSEVDATIDAAIVQEVK